jgi:hypothetical protein
MDTALVERSGTQAVSRGTSRSRIWLVLERSSQICARLSVIGGVIVGLYGLYDSLEKQREAAEASRLQSLAYIQQFITEDFAVQREVTRLNLTQVLPPLEELAEKSPGRELYFSDALGEIPSIGEHYERMGAEVKLGYLDFALIFEVVPFPDDFWMRTTKLKTQLRKNWNGTGGAELPDLWGNFDGLAKQYKIARADAERKRAEKPSLWRALRARI